MCALRYLAFFDGHASLSPLHVPPIPPFSYSCFPRVCDPGAGGSCGISVIDTPRERDREGGREEHTYAAAVATAFASSTQMSDFQEVLSPAQLAKHYEVLHFLTHHPNQPYALAQLDALLPRGVAVQRFPDEWFALIADGACWHRSIELHRPAAHGGKVDAADDAAAGRAQWSLVCARAAVTTLAELQRRLESPSTLLDPDSCVALHTDQIVIQPALVRKAVQMGLAYYFPDAYDKNEYRQFAAREDAAGDEGGGRAVAGQATAALRDALMRLDEAGESGGAGNATSGGASGSAHLLGRNRTYLLLPPGVAVHHRLLTRRGVPEQEAHSLPTRLRVGERVLLLFDNATAVRKLGRPNELRVEWTVTSVRLADTGDDGPTVRDRGAGRRMEALAATPVEPLRIRREVLAVRSAVPVNDVQGTNSSISSSASAAATSPMRPPAPVLVSNKVKMELEAVQPCTLKLILTVNGAENVLTIDVLDELIHLPGVLVRRDRALDSFALPEADLLPDPIVNPAPADEFPYESVLHAASSPRDENAPGGTSTAAAAAASSTDVASQPWAELVPLPWTQSPSPAVAALREVTFPVQDATVRAATRAVFSAQSLADEARLRSATERLRREADARAGLADGGKRRRRPPTRTNAILRNRHLLHYGLDFSIPFSKTRR